MSKLLRQNRRPTHPLCLMSTFDPKRVTYSSDAVPYIELSNGDRVKSSCLRCPTTPCVSYTPYELNNTHFVDFPFDRSPDVCPTNAINVNEKGIPEIDEASCVGCGICVSRCPSGAIYLKRGIATVNVFYENCDYKEGSLRQHNLCLEKLILVHKQGCMGALTTKSVEKVHTRLATITTSPQFPNIMARNLLMALGVGCSIVRRGDVYLRMDGVLGPPAVQYGAIEIELGVELLDLPRNMLDNVAVLVSRYGLQAKEIEPVIVCYQLPNARSEYWRVVQDISKVLDLSINTLTFSALIIMLWCFKKLDFRLYQFYADIHSTSIRGVVEEVIGNALTLPIGFLSILEASK